MSTQNEFNAARARIAELEAQLTEVRKNSGAFAFDLLTANDDLAAERTAHLATQRALCDSAHIIHYNATGTTFIEFCQAHKDAYSAARTAVAQADGKEAV